MRTVKASDTQVVIIATFDELADLRSAIAMRHGEFCVGDDNCPCSAQEAELADPA